MAMVEEKEVDNTHYIPKNFTDGGRVFDGMIAVRNLVEACIFSGGLFWIEKDILYFPSDKTMIVTIVVTVIPLAILCIIGIAGDPLTIFFVKAFMFLKNRRRTRFKRIYTNPRQLEKQRRKEKRGRR